MQAGLIPVYDQRKATQKNNLYLIGDAAGQVKATTGGGLVPGIKAALICAESIRNRTNYHKAWKKSLGKELMTHLLIRNTLDRFTDSDYDALLQKLSDKKITKIFKKHNRDSGFRIALSLISRKPSLIKFAPKLF